MTGGGGPSGICRVAAFAMMSFNISPAISQDTFYYFHTMHYSGMKQIVILTFNQHR